MITFKPAQNAIDAAYVKRKHNNIVFNGVIENNLSDHNLISFQLNL